MRLFNTPDGTIDEGERVNIQSPPFDLEFGPGGYQLFRGVGGLGSVDYTTVLATIQPGKTSFTVTGLGHAVSTRYTYVLRPIQRNGYLVTPDYSCWCEFVTDSNGDWVGTRPAKVDSISAEVIDSGKIRLRWVYHTPSGYTAPEDFGIYYSTSSTITAGSPNTTESYTSDGRYTEDITLTDGVTYWFGITARSSGSVESPMLTLGDPYVADATGPDTPDLYADTSW